MCGFGVSPTLWEFYDVAGRCLPTYLPTYLPGAARAPPVPKREERKNPKWLNFCCWCCSQVRLARQRSLRRSRFRSFGWPRVCFRARFSHCRRCIWWRSLSAARHCGERLNDHPTHRPTEPTHRTDPPNRPTTRAPRVTDRVE